MANKNFKVKNGITIPEPLAITDGGTGQTSAQNALNALLPVQTSASSKFLQSDGTNVSWVANVAYQRGNTASRPASPNVGDLYFNTQLNYFESYTISGWFPIAAAPGIPTGVTATNQPSGRAYNNGQMSVAFSPNSSAGAPSSYIVTPTPTTSPSTFTGSSSPVTVTGLASSTQYTYTVVATSPYGTSSASSASSGVTSTTVPQAPTIGTATTDNAQSSVSFIAGATGGSTITSYTVTSNPGNITASGASSPIMVTGLNNGTAYTFTVTATNTNGTSLASAATSSVIPSAFSPTGSYDALATYTVPAGGVSSITFAGLPTDGRYSHLQIRSTARFSGGDLYYALQLNEQPAESANNRMHRLYGTGSSVGSSSDANYAPWVWMPNNSQNSNVFAAAIIDILDYTSVNKSKVVRILTGYDNNGSGQISLTSGAWFVSSEPVNKIFLNAQAFGSTSVFAERSTFSVYGVKG